MKFTENCTIELRKRHRIKANRKKRYRKKRRRNKYL